MSTTTPMKFKKVSANWETIKGSYHEAPTSFDFSKESNIRAKNKKGYDKHYIYTDESGNTCFVVERKKKDDGSKYFSLHSKKQHKSQGYHKWMEAEYPEPRPIYNLQKLGNDKHKLNLVIFEGEKAAEAYARNRLYQVTPGS